MLATNHFSEGCGWLRVVWRPKFGFLADPLFGLVDSPSMYSRCAIAA
ncbi:hypothetical protein H6F46_15135 [Limnothrix sp. FACHB-1083]|nr:MULTISPECIES: hypothetical protein [unclassified Limnothrix]MBD2162029.1 hypothetical protein [Limnothrix sp. FACHB-1083]MBD2192921.1 hypothetical protein [Limnothrix sp. FACHB-1088]